LTPGAGIGYTAAHPGNAMPSQAPPPAWRTLLPAMILAAGVIQLAGAEPPGAPPGWTLAWHDEFDGTQLDRAKWGFDLGNSLKAGTTSIKGWGNDELEFYTDRPDNAFVMAGELHIRALKEQYQGCAYTSARLISRGLMARTYGRFEIRAKLPLGKGAWSALWMLPQDNAYGSWASSGEIDIMEARGQQPEKVLGTLHYGSRWPKNTFTGREFTFPAPGGIDAYHVYSLEWQPGSIRWYVDGMLYADQDFWWSSSAHDGAGNGVAPGSEAELNPWPAPFDKPFYLIMNLAVGGRFLGNPDEHTPFPAELVVDYVRVYERSGGTPAATPRGEGKLPFPGK
jgi:beta-glucanase (GH16 family)